MVLQDSAMVLFFASLFVDVNKYKEGIRRASIASPPIVQVKREQSLKKVRT